MTKQKPKISIYWIEFGVKLVNTCVLYKIGKEKTFCEKVSARN